MPILKTSTEIRAERDRLLELANDPDPLVRLTAAGMRISLNWSLGETDKETPVRFALYVGETMAAKSRSAYRYD